ncbi:BTB/POZ and MATH domain-containing protein 2-like [Oryza glaberrima]|uniref:BTB domain-containing protein n=1 Tax=Oryza glaberrima TaxID=4538 RepID=I1QZR7_ORYGL|nr:BTB/POZ and MATH domain-containing protein 2-like [Oryza glaberrima]
MYSITAAPATVSHLVRIDGYSRTKNLRRGRFIEAMNFTVGGHRWFIRFYPNGHGPRDVGVVSVYVGIAGAYRRGGGDAKPVIADARFSLVDRDGRPAPPSFVQGMPAVDFSGNDFGMNIKRAELETSGFLKDDGFLVRCELGFVNSAGDGDGRRGVQIKEGIKVPPPNLHRHLADLLWKNQSSGDVFIEVQGKTFTAHRWMLAARSPVMAAELSSSDSDDAADTDADATKNTMMTLRVDDDMDAETFRALLHFIYTDALPPPPQPRARDTKAKEDEAAAAEAARRLHAAAARYGMERLQLMCEDALCRSLSVLTVASTLVFAEKHGCRVLKAACLDFLSCKRKLRQVTRLDDDFRLLTTTCPSVIKELFAQVLK